MSRPTAGFLAMVLVSAGIAVMASDPADRTQTLDQETISFVTMKSDEGAVVQITVGDLILTAPKLTMRSKSGKERIEITAQDEKVVWKRSPLGSITRAKEIKLSLQGPIP